MVLKRVPVKKRVLLMMRDELMGRMLDRWMELLMVPKMDQMREIKTV